MSQLSKRSTVYFDENIHQALRIKAVTSQRSLSEVVNAAVKLLLSEDQQDLSTFEQRINEPTMSYETLLDQLKVDGKL